MFFLCFFNPFYLYISDFFRNFVLVMKIAINPIYSHLKTHKIMNKTVRIIVQIIAAICAGLLGGAGAQTLM